MAPSLSLPPEDVFQAALSADTELRQRYLAIDPSASLHSADDDHRELLERSAALLEVLAGSACLLEASREEAAPPLNHPTTDSRAYYRDRVRQLCGLDLEETIPRAIKTLHLMKPQNDRPVFPKPEVVLRAVRSLLEACPIDYLEAVGHQSGLDRTTHRCRFAYDNLRAYVIRNDPGTSIRVRLVGRGYSQGVLDAGEAATLLDVSIPDAIALLEAHGHQRPLDLIELTSATRAERLSSIRADRLARNGEVAFSRALLFRDVLASERIENIDARKWLPEDLM